jgi:hypothetical protein
VIRPLVAALVVAVVGAVLSSSPARAAANDLNIAGLIHKKGAGEAACTVDGKLACDNAGFRALVRELGLVMTPTSLQPAETTGQSGFDFGLDYTFHTMRFNEEYWHATRGIEERDVPLLMTIGASAHKGFVLPVPLTSEVDFGAQYLIDSSLVDIHGKVRVALNEGFRFIPDLAIEAGISRMLGNNDLDLLTVSAGGQISKGFGIMGTFNLCPYVGYDSIWVNGSSRIIDTNPSDSGNVDDNAVFDIVPLGVNRMDRVSVGARIIIAVVTITGGLDMNFVDPVAGTNAGSDKADLLLQYSIRAGVTF